MLCVLYGELFVAKHCDWLRKTVYMLVKKCVGGNLRLDSPYVKHSCCSPDTQITLKKDSTLPRS